MPRNHAIDWIKWAAIASMFVDHLKYAPGAPGALFYVGRFAYPAFAVLCAYNLAFNSRRPLVFTARVWLLALLCEGVKFFLASVTHAGFPRGLNPVFALAAGTLLLATIRQPGWLLFLSLPLAWVAGNFAGYGWAGVLCVVSAGLSCSSGVFYGLLILSCAWLNLPNIEAATISAIAGPLVLAMTTLRLPRTPCILPNNRLLYLAFPLSFVPPAILKWLGSAL